MKSTIALNADQGRIQINKNIYGHFAEHLGRCIYEGIWVGEDSPIANTKGMRDDVVAALREARIPVLRWPGGCFADEYHWRDGVGPREQRPSMVNTHWGGVVENNHFGTHEFFDLCELLGAEPYICGNVGSGTVQEMQEWVEYITFAEGTPVSEWRKQNGREAPWKLKYFGVGNENWGCGGNMRPEYYADEYRRYQTYVRNLSGNEVYKIACGPSKDDYHWTEVLMREATPYMDGLSLHYYTVPGERPQRGSATQFDENEWFITLKKTLFMEELVKRHSTIMDKYDPQKRVGLIVDEWGTWYDVEPGTHPGFLYQQNTLRDALVAGINLNIFNNHCDRVRMANIAQTVNVLQAMVLTEGDKCIKTPTFHVFEMLGVHQDAWLVPLGLSSAEYKHGEETLPQISASASRTGHTLNLSLCNLSHSEEATVDCDIRGVKAVVEGSARILVSGRMQDCNTFAEPDKVKPAEFSDWQNTGKQLHAVLPPMSVAVFQLIVED